MTAPHKSECPAATGQNANKNTDSPSLTPAKRFATVRAKFALLGHTLHASRQSDGTVDYMAERWGLVRYLPSLDAADRFLIQIGGRP